MSSSRLLPSSSTAPNVELHLIPRQSSESLKTILPGQGQCSIHIEITRALLTAYVIPRFTSHVPRFQG